MTKSYILNTQLIDRGSEKSIGSTFGCAQDDLASTHDHLPGEDGHGGCPRSQTLVVNGCRWVPVVSPWPGDWGFWARKIEVFLWNMCFWGIWATKSRGFLKWCSGIGSFYYHTWGVDKWIERLNGDTLWDMWRGIQQSITWKWGIPAQ